MTSKDIIPAGVTLRDFDDFESARREVFDGVQSEVKQAFPIEYGNFTMNVEDLDYEDPETYDPQKQKDARLRDQNLARRLRGTVVLRDKAGAELERKRLTLMRVPYLTERGTFVRSGNDYSFANQLRLLPGVFTRIQQNGELETQFNVRPGTGSNFRVSLDPEKQQFRLEIKDSRLHLYSLLRDIGMDEAALEKTWGPEIFESNKSKYDSKVLDKAYSKLVARWEQKEGISREEKIAAVREAFERAQIHEPIARRNLPSMFDRAKAASWRREAAHYKDAPFEPDFSAADLGKVFQEPANDWQEWYIGYSNGHRGPGDRQKKIEWNRARRKHLLKFAATPTLGRYFELQKYAINALLCIPDSDRETVFSKLTRDDKEKRAQIKLAAFTERELEQLAQHLNEQESAGLPTEGTVEDMERAILAYIQNASSILPAESGALPAVRNFAPASFDATSKSAGEGGRGCLMVRVPTYTGGRIVGWVQDKVPETELTGRGYEHEVHVTVAYGFSKDVTVEEIKDALRKWGSYQVDFTCGKVTRFSNPKQDVLKVDIDSRDLRSLHQFLRDEFGERLKINFPDYHPHMTLAYVKPKALSDLDGHCRFEGDVFTTSVLVFSVAGSETKTYINLHDLHA